MKKFILLSTAAALLSSCGIYTKYKPAESVPDNLYGEEFGTEDTTSLGSMDWHELLPIRSCRPISNKVCRTIPIICLHSFV